MHNNLAAFLYVRGLTGEDFNWDHVRVISNAVEASLLRLKTDLDHVCEDTDETDIQSVFYEAGKLHFAHNLKWWFQVLYQVFLSENQGPRLGQFTKIMTVYWVQDKIDQVLGDYWQSQVVNQGAKE